MFDLVPVWKTGNLGLKLRFGSKPRFGEILKQTVIFVQTGFWTKLWFKTKVSDKLVRVAFGTVNHV